MGRSRPSRSSGSEPERRVTTLSDLRAARPEGLSNGADAARQRAVDVDRALHDLAADASATRPCRLGHRGRRLRTGRAVAALRHRSPVPVAGSRSRSTVIQSDAEELLYPLWDAGFQVGHAVANPKEAIDRCSRRHPRSDRLARRRVWSPVPGGPFEEFIDRRTRWLRKERKTIVRRIVEATARATSARRQGGWMLAPDLKEDMRRAARREHRPVARRRSSTREPPAELNGPVRAADGRARGPALRGDAEARPRPHRTAAAGRRQTRHRARGQSGRTDVEGPLRGAAGSSTSRRSTVERYVDQAIGGPRRSGLAHTIWGWDTRRGRPSRGEGGRTALGRHRASGCWPRIHRRVAPIAAPDLAWLERVFASEIPIERWDADMRAAFLEALQGTNAEAALQLADHVGAWPVMLPEWENVRGRAQHDPVPPLHRRRTLVRRHRIDQDMPRDGPAGAVRRGRDQAISSRSISEPLLHDVGKGPAKTTPSRASGSREGQPPGWDSRKQQTEEVAALVRHHLLLSDTATRRDLDDGSVIAGVVATIGDRTPSPDALHPVGRRRSSDRTRELEPVEGIARRRDIPKGAHRARDGRAPAAQRRHPTAARARGVRPRRGRLGRTRS